MNQPNLETAQPQQAKRRAADLIAVSGCVLLTAWVQRHALSAFFSSPDDLVHLQQAVGLRPVLPSPFRFLSQVIYFRVMTWFFGPAPGPFHLVSLLVHLLNVALVFHFVRMAGASRTVASVSAGCFGTFPLFFPLLSSAVGMNDELALTFSLVALIFVQRGGAKSVVMSCASFVMALLCKESVLAMPLLALLVGQRGQSFRKVLPLLVTAGVFAGLLLALPPQGLGPYAIGLGSNVFHNLMTYVAWATNLTRPLPDLVSSYDPSAWRVGVWFYAALLVSWVALGRDRPLIRLGVVWWVIGLLPVLPLRFQTYRHYLYPAIPGLALALSSIAASGVARLLQATKRSEGTPPTRGAREWIVSGVLAACLLAYGIRAEHLIRERLRARVPGTSLALDPVIRRQEVARRALTSLHAALERTPGRTRIVILAPEGTGRVFGARSGREYPRRAIRSHGYDLLQESLDHGGAVRLFFPQVDSVAFISRWSAAYVDFDLFFPYQFGELLGVGRGRDAHLVASRIMFEWGWSPQARDYLEAVLHAYPDDPALLLAFSEALSRSGDRAGARRQLEALARRAPGDSAAVVARHLLGTWRE